MTGNGPPKRSQVKAPPPVRTFVEKAQIVLSLMFRDFVANGGAGEGQFLDFLVTQSGMAEDRLGLVELYQSRAAELSTPTPATVSKGTALFDPNGPGLSDLQDRGLGGSPFAAKDPAG